MDLQVKLSELKNSLTNWQARFDEAETLIKKTKAQRELAMRQLDIHTASINTIEEILAQPAVSEDKHKAKVAKKTALSGDNPN